MYSDMTSSYTYDRSFARFVKLAMDGTWVPGETVPALCIYRDCGFPLDMMDSGWSLTPADVTMVGEVVAAGGRGMDMMRESFHAKMDCMADAVVDATNGHTAAVAKMKYLWHALRLSAFERAVRTKAPCGPVDITVYRACAQTLGINEDMRGLRTRVEETADAEGMVQWLLRLDADLPEPGPIWPRAEIRGGPLQAP